MPTVWSVGPIMATSRQTPTPSCSSRKKRRLVERPVDLDSFFSSGLPGKLRFLILSSTEEGKTLKCVSACRFAHNLQQQIGEVQSVTRQRNGTLLLEVRTDVQIAKVISLKCIACLQVKVENHPTLNLCKGVITNQDFTSESEEVLKSFLVLEGVVNVHRLCRKVDGNFVRSTTLILTFDRPSLPDRISCGFFNPLVRQYVPNPLRCFKCQRFEHTQEHCRPMSEAICASYGQKGHSPPCQCSPHCINCDDPHGPKFQMQRNFRATDKVSFPEAQRRYQAQHPVDFSRSFVSVLKSSNSKSFSSQTTRPIRRSVHCQVTLTSLTGVQEKSPRLLKIVTPTV